MQNLLNFIITKYLKQKVNDDLNVCVEQRSPCAEVEIRENVLTGHKLTDLLKAESPSGVTMIHENVEF